MESKRGRGRPPKPKPNFVAITDFSLDRVHTLSNTIAEYLDTEPGVLTERLAEAGAHYELMAEIRERGVLVVKRKGNRPNVHLARLLADCALIQQDVTGKSARDALAQAGGWEESGHAPPSMAKVYALAVLHALGIYHPQSLRTQARRALLYV